MNDFTYSPELQDGDDLDVIQLVGLKLGEEEYAIDVLKIQEIIRTVEITIVPRSDSYVLGVMNLRGKVIPVVDLRVRFNLEKVDFDKETRIIVVRFEKENIGFVVDEVTEVIRISKQMVEPTPPLVGAVGQEYILGICKFNDRLIILLDIDRVVELADAISSSLRQRFLGNNASGKGGKGKPATKVAQVAKPAPAVATERLRSMADEADAMSKPLIMSIDDDEDSDDYSDLLSSVEEQAKLSQPTGVHVEQGELDALIANELSKREAETDALNRKKKAGAATLSVDDEIAMELAKREKETEELNRQKKAVSAQSAKLSVDDEIAIELAKREAETDELNRQKRQNLETQNLETQNLETQNLDQKKNDIDEAPVVKTSPSRQLTESQKRSVDKIDMASLHMMDDGNNGDDPILPDSVEDLKEIATKIISGETADIDISVKGEMGELVNLLSDIKKKVDSIPPAVYLSQSGLPTVSETLSSVDSATGKAVVSLLENTKMMESFYKELDRDVRELVQMLPQKNKEAIEAKIADTMAKVESAGKIGFSILESLEFQDITEQQLRKVVKNIEELGTRLGSIVGLMYSQGKSSKAGATELLADLGFA